jgi:ribonucleoside-diphosphate reductase alpha chain
MIHVRKHSGELELLDYSKAEASLEWAIGDIPNVSLSEIEVQSKLHFFDGISTSYITDIFIKTCDDLADLRNPNYAFVARNLKLQRLYKHVFKSIHPPSLTEFLTERISNGHYSANLHPETLQASGIQVYAFEQAIDHSCDFTFTSSGLDSLINGYKVCDYETPQFMFMAIAIDVFRDYHTNPTEYIIDFYNALSTFEITLPSPQMRALRTDSTDYASCITFRMGDSITSWNECDKAIVNHTVASAGIGMDIANVASIGDKVKNGKIKHSGKLAVLNEIDAQIRRCSQNGKHVALAA